MRQTGSAVQADENLKEQLLKGKKLIGRTALCTDVRESCNIYFKAWCLAWVKISCGRAKLQASRYESDHGGTPSRSFAAPLHGKEIFKGCVWTFKQDLKIAEHGEVNIIWQDYKELLRCGKNKGVDISCCQMLS